MYLSTVFRKLNKVINDYCGVFEINLLRWRIYVYIIYGREKMKKSQYKKGFTHE